MDVNNKIARRDVLRSALALGALGSVSRYATSEENSYKNVLLLIADDHGLDMPAYGNRVIQTPNLDNLAAQGVFFRHAYCTTPSCSASRSCILTGLHNHRNGQFGHAHDYNHFSTFNWIQSLPQLLKNRGYTTGVIGKLHVSPASTFPFDSASLDLPDFLHNRNVTAMAKKAKQFFEENRDHPFYLHVGFADPHRYRKGFGNQIDGLENPPVTYSPNDVNIPGFLPDWPVVRQELAEYYQSVSRMDYGVGLILKALKEAGKDKDTLVIYLSDNGIAFPGAKTNLYDPGVRLPFIVCSPLQKKRGIENNAMISFVDLVPTILEWTGADAPPYPLHGRSFLPILEEENPSGWDEVFFSHTFHEITMYYPSRGIRTRRYKYLNNLAHQLPFPFASDLYACATWQEVLNRKSQTYGPRRVADYIHRPAEELYDLENDPLELNNLAGTPAAKSALEEHRRRTLEFREQTKDPWLILNNYAEM